MLNKIILSMIMVLFCVACSDKKASSDVDATENTEKCKENSSLPECKTPNDVPCEKLSGVEVCADDLPPNISIETYAYGDVVEFKWQNTLPWYYETENYPYGFDKDPMSNWSDRIEAGKDVYVSVAKGEEPASVDLKIPTDMVKNISLVDKNGTEVCSAGTCQGTILLNAGDYRLMNGTVDLDRNVHVIAYDKKGPYEITYVQFDGGLSTPCSEAEGCYTKESVKENVNTILAQAVMSVDFDDIQPSDLGLGDIFEVDVTEKNLDPFYADLEQKIKGKNKIYSGYLNALQSYNDAVEDCNNEVKDETWCNENISILKDRYDDKYEKYLTNGVREVYAINNLRLIWRLNGQGSSLSLNLNNFEDFSSVYAKLNSNYMIEDGGKVPLIMKSYSNSCASGVGKNGIPVVANLISHDDKTNTFTISLQNQMGQAISFSEECDYLYADTYGFVPGLGAAQITFPRTLKGKPFGGVVFAPRQEGKASHNTIVHEIGHTFGLSDLYVDENDPSVPYCLNKSGDGRYVYSGPVDGVTGDALVDYLSKRKCNFVTTEADLMNYIVPTGPRLRYRPLPIVGTGTNIPNGTYDSQWECLQNADCGKYK